MTALASSGSQRRRRSPVSCRRSRGRVVESARGRFLDSSRAVGSCLTQGGRWSRTGWCGDVTRSDSATRSDSGECRLPDRPGWKPAQGLRGPAQGEPRFTWREASADSPSCSPASSSYRSRAHNSASLVSTPPPARCSPPPSCYSFSLARSSLSIRHSSGCSRVCLRECARRRIRTRDRGRARTRP